MPEHYRPDRFGAMFVSDRKLSVDPKSDRVLRVTALEENVFDKKGRLIESICQRICQRAFRRGDPVRETIYVPHGFRGSGPLGAAYDTRTENGRTWQIEKELTHLEYCEIEHILSLSV